MLVDFLGWILRQLLSWEELWTHFLFENKRKTSRRVIFYTLKEKKFLGNVKYRDYEEKGRYLIEDVELKLENKDKDLPKYSRQDW